ncbi:unnamed protein product [Fusarium graminearum]|uniref:Chromosome 4, complete genome n=1 Tax=Gibberella zeae (strain ATCC MYA-4620 / CBS 123657 / FGSC 9075 / NRRL 31084 / PH-1) TaxID=229533 RepID=A0A098DSC9_GIBZE|nr:unnamed protein product [Fusarium graminearum]CAF3525499.1 unnamed protein product [Fusarium graminearum]CEF84785.1 unnamed protein product [Fusarium graminearum]
MKDDILAMRQTTDGADQSQDASADAASGHSLGQPLSLYDQLSKDYDCTRLLRIDEANDGDPITCTMSEIPFGDKPKFDALSYIVRQNLWDALHYLRKHCPDTSYWIDAVCINQNDIDERNRQVRIMHHIYFRAQTVVVWLGKTYSQYEALVPQLRRLCHMNARIEETTPESTPEPTQTGSSVRDLAVELCNDAYWKRLWIIQEIGLAREIKVCFGNCAIEWRQFRQFLVTNGLESEGPMKL